MPENHHPQAPRRVLRYIRENPWAMIPSAFEMMLEVVEMRAAGVRLTHEEAHARIEAAGVARRVAVNAPGSIAVIPLFGVLAQRMDMFLEISEGTSYERFNAAIRQAREDPNVSDIFIHVDSPGGACLGCEEAAELVFSSRSFKPIRAVVDGAVAASAAYFIASQAQELVASPSSEVGSIGAICLHEDISGAADMAGVKYTLLSYPPGGHKGEGNPYEPLPDEVRDYYLSRLADYGGTFEKAVARGRGVKLAKVKSDFGQGRMLGAQAALAAGMIDRIGTLQSEIERLVKKGGKGGGARAEVMTEGEFRALGDVPAWTAGVAPQPDADREEALARLELAGKGAPA